MKVVVPQKEQIYSFVDKYFGILAALLIFIIVIAGFTWIIFPTWQKVRDVDVLNVEGKQAQLQEAQSFLAELKTMRAAYEQIEYADIKRLETILPRGLNQDSLYLQLQTFGQEVGLTVSSISFTTNSVVTDATRRQASSTPTSQASRVEQAIINLGVDGIDSYETFLAFLEQVQSYAPILELTSVKYPESGTAASFSFTTYYLAE